MGRILVQSSDTIEFDLDVIPYQFKYLPRHYDMVELMTPEQKRARMLAKRKKYRKRDQLKRVEKRNIMMSKEGTITDLNKNDVLCGRGGRINSHVGNVQFRSIIQSKKSNYLVQDTSAGKTTIVAGIVNTIHAQNPAAGRFLQQDKKTRLWFEIGDAKAYTKTGQGLREGAPARIAEHDVNRTPGRSHSPFAATVTPIDKLDYDPLDEPEDSFVFTPIPTSSILEFQSWITTRKRSWRTKYLQKVKDAIEARNNYYFNNHFASSFPDIPEEEKNHTTVTVIPESDPEAIFKACVNNAAMTLHLAPPEDDRTFYQVGGKLPVTDEMYDGFTVTGQGICHIFKKKNWDGCIDVGDYYPHGIEYLPDNLAGGICEHGLIPLQSKRKIWVDMQRHMDGW